MLTPSTSVGESSGQGKEKNMGNLRAASATALKRNICQLTGIVEEKVQVKRKYKTLGGNKIQ